ncbi:MAG TPA: CHRD domain-containing protein [Stellaceae bacterium]|nr:CHRD domain-containing protein [Stellaceae bacterium]
MHHPRFIIIAAFAVLMVSATGHAATRVFKATLNGSSEVPPTTSTATGTATASLDTATRRLSWEVTYSGLTGPAKAAHIHGPAAPGRNAPVAVPLTGSLASPIKGSAVLTAAQVASLEAGDDYINIHTAKNPGGEIRGQLMPAP